MKWICRALFFTLVAWLASQTIVERVSDFPQFAKHAELLMVLTMLLVLSALFALLDWGRTIEDRIRKTVAQILAEQNNAGR